MNLTVRQVARMTMVAILLLTVFISPSPAPADAPAPKLKTQTIRISINPDHEDKQADRSITLVQLPPGKIALKDEKGKPVEHTIKPIWMARYETRWDEYDVFWMALDLDYVERRQLPRRRTEMSYRTPDGNFGHYGYPANCIGFDAARRYCEWLSTNTGKHFRLPTEAEWEYACRAGGPPLKPDAEALDKIAWVWDNADEKPHPVGKKQPNAWGLYDMLGNVGEFVIRDPKSDKGLLAGGSYKDYAEDVHSGTREPESHEWYKNDPEEPPMRDWLSYTVHHVGFRVVMEE